jgi:hypothetical protein
MVIKLNIVYTEFTKQEKKLIIRIAKEVFYEIIIQMVWRR